MKPTVPVQLLRDGAKMPHFGSAYAAGADLCACLENSTTTLDSGETKLIPTGIAMEIPEGYVGLICARSGIAVKRGLAPANKVGVIDSDYRGEILVALHNHSAAAQQIENGERIAQIILTPYLAVNYVQSDTLSATDRGAGGFGSTGTK